MTTYHVWLTGQDQPEVVRAEEVFAGFDELLFFDRNPDGSAAVRRSLTPNQWTKWSIVHDEADHI